MRASKWMYKVLCVDTFDWDEWSWWEYNTLEKAIEVADKKSSTMLKTYVYDDEWDYVYDWWTY